MNETEATQQTNADSYDENSDEVNERSSNIYIYIYIHRYIYYQKNGCLELALWQQAHSLRHAHGSYAVSL